MSTTQERKKLIAQLTERRDHHKRQYEFYEAKLSEAQKNMDPVKNRQQAAKKVALIDVMNPPEGFWGSEVEEYCAIKIKEEIMVYTAKEIAHYVWDKYHLIKGGNARKRVSTRIYKQMHKYTLGGSFSQNGLKYTILKTGSLYKRITWASALKPKRK